MYFVCFRSLIYKTQVIIALFLLLTRRRLSAAKPTYHKINLTHAIHLYEEHYRRSFHWTVFSWNEYFPILPKKEKEMVHTLEQWNDAFYNIQLETTVLCRSMVDELYLYGWLEPDTSFYRKYKQTNQHTRKHTQIKNELLNTAYSAIASFYSGDIYTPSVYAFETIQTILSSTSPDPSSNNQIQIRIDESERVMEKTRRVYQQAKQWCTHCFYIEIKYHNRLIWFDGNANCTFHFIQLFKQVYNRIMFVREIERQYTHTHSYKKWVNKSQQQKVEIWLQLLECFSFFSAKEFSWNIQQIARRRSHYSISTLLEYIKREKEGLNELLKRAYTLFPKIEQKVNIESRIMKERRKWMDIRVVDVTSYARFARNYTEYIGRIYSEVYISQIYDLFYIPLSMMLRTTIQCIIQIIQIPLIELTEPLLEWCKKMIFYLFAFYGMLYMCLWLLRKSNHMLLVYNSKYEGVNNEKRKMGG